MLLVGCLNAQELTGVQAQRVNKRYEIKFDLYNFNWGEKFDIYVFASREGSNDWFKAKALVGSYQNVESRNEYIVLWEPVLDYKPYAKYDFKLYAVNRSYTKINYDYETTEQVGLLHVISTIPDADHYIGDSKISVAVPIAVPAGDYEVTLRTGTNIRGRAGVKVEPMKYKEVELVPQEGFLSASSNESGAVFNVLGKSYVTLEKLTLPVGDYSVEAIAPESLRKLKLANQVARVTILQGKETKCKFDFPIGFLTLVSNEERVGYSVDGEYLGTSVQKLKLAEGVHKVSARSENANTLINNSILESDVTITKGQEITTSFKFAYGYLTLRNNLENCTYTLDNIRVERPEKMKLPVGTHTYTANYISPYSPIMKSFTLKSGEELVESLRFVVDKKAIRAERRSQFHSLFYTYPLQHIRIDHNFGFKESDRLSYQNYNYKPISNSISVSGIQVRDMTRIDSYDYYSRANIGDPFFYVGFGILDKVVIGNEIGNSQTGIMFDWLSGIAGVSGINKAGTIYSTLEGKLLWSGQYPLYKHYSVDGENYIFVNRFLDHSSEDNPSGEGEPRRAIRTSNMSQLGLEVDYEIGFRLGAHIFLSTKAGVRYQSDFGGGWFTRSQLDQWYNFTTDEPEPNNDQRLPQRNVMMDGLTFRLGVGIGIPLSSYSYSNY